MTAVLSLLRRVVQAVPKERALRARICSQGRSDWPFACFLWAASARQVYSRIAAFGRKRSL